MWNTFLGGLVYNPSKAFLSFIDVGWDLQFGELCFSVLRESGPVGLLEVHERFVLAYLGFNVSGAAYNNWEVVGPEGDLGLPAGVGKEGEGGEGYVWGSGLAIWG